MSLKLLHLPELSERHIEMLAKVIADWCDANPITQAPIARKPHTQPPLIF
jgi:hypothetical protein